MSNIKLNLEKEALVVAQAEYILKKDGTIRGTAKAFNISKSQTHQNFRTKLKDIDFELYQEVDALLRKNWDERNIRGGMALKLKMQYEKQNKKM